MSSSSREYSPDWLRSSQAPLTASIFTLSSSSDDDQLPISSVTRKPSDKKRKMPDETEGNTGGREFAKGRTIPKKPQESERTVWELPSDSEHELSEGQSQKFSDDDDGDDVETPLKSASKSESSKKRLQQVPAETKRKSITEQENHDDDDDGDVKVLERETTDEKQTGPYISSSRLPLVVADKVQRSKVVVECEGESIDLSGDLGCVGRVVISSGNQEDMMLDLKGTIYKTTIIPSRTLCVVSFGQSEAKIEAIMNDFIQLTPQSNVYEAETMVEGTLEGFSFDSEDEEGADKQARSAAAAAADDENEPQTNGKIRGKPEAAAGAKKKGKTKPATKKVVNNKNNRKKAPVAKKTKAKK